nr:MAG TPA: hypothetical protein [Inoviridae sp.]
MWVSLGIRRFYTRQRPPVLPISVCGHTLRTFGQGYKPSIVHAKAIPTRLLEGTVPERAHLFRGGVQG